MAGPFKGKIILIKKNLIMALAICLVVVGIFYVINNPAIVGESATERALPIYSVQRDYKAVSLTFNATDEDDEYTAQVVNALNAYGVRATFFVTGDWVRANSNLAAKMVESGHELMNLSDDYSFMRQLGTMGILENITACNDAIEEATGVRPTMFRAPYGDYDDNVIETVSAMGMQTIQWSIDSGDWKGLDSQSISERVVSKSFSGGIVLLHSGLEQTVMAVPDIIQGLLREGYALVPVSQLIIQSEYTISPTGRQIPA